MLFRSRGGREEAEQKLQQRDVDGDVDGWNIFLGGKREREAKNKQTQTNQNEADVMSVCVASGLPLRPVLSFVLVSLAHGDKVS